MNQDQIRSSVRIGVIGGSRAKADALAQAFEVGRLIAGRGAILVCGGLAGVMEEAARGAHGAGGLTIGILPGMRTAEANPHIDIALVTGMGYSRNSLVAMNADVLIAIAGEYGTLSEIAYSRIYGKTVVGLGSWEIEGVIRASTPEEAVRLAWEAVEGGR